MYYGINDARAQRSTQSTRPTQSDRGSRFRFQQSRPQRRPSRGRGQFIHPDRFINKARAVVAPTPYEAKHTFADFGLMPALLRSLELKGYTAPTAIQDQTIPAILEGRDLMGLANTGTGKTVAFLLPAIHRLKTVNRPQTVLVITPTRELATQIYDEFRWLAAGLGLGAAVCVGGMSIGRQIHALARRPQVIIGTPGRLKDLLNRRVLKLHTITTLVLDEADRMLDMGFIADIRFLMEQMPAERQSLCFSATITPQIQELVSTLLKQPVKVSVKTGETSDHVHQDVVRVRDNEDKFNQLTTLLATPEFEKVLIFGETKWGVQKLADKLTAYRLPAEAIHGNKSQSQRQRALDAFKQGGVKILVATDVASRGLDIPDVSHVINFDQPATYDDYVHRIGRTGRAGKLGQALTFI